ncbi:hypothetical protein [Mycoplasma sp. BRA285]
MLNTMLVTTSVIITIKYVDLNIGNAYAWFSLIWINMVVEWAALEAISIALFPFLKWIRTTTLEQKWKELKY